MEKSPTIIELAKALIKFQNEMEPVVYDASNPFFKSKYATLAKLVSMASPIATKHGLAVSQLVEGEGGVTTILMHESGEYLASTLTLKASKDDPQGHGSAITYARRYAYASILGLISEDDDDGNKASNLKATTDKPTETTQLPPSPNLRKIVEMMGEVKFGDLDKFTAWRIDNALPESLDGLTDFQLTKIRIKLQEIKK